jgi:hypothetical protein
MKFITDRVMNDEKGFLASTSTLPALGLGEYGGSGIKLGEYRVSLRPVRQCPRQASTLSGTYLPDDFSCDA